RFVEIDENGVAKDAALRARRWVGVPAMNGVIRALAAPLHVHWATRAVAIGGEAGAWTLELEGADAPAGPFERIFLAIPAEQAAPLLAPVCRDFAAVAAACTSAPSWTAMFAFNAPLEMSYDAARIAGGPLGWVARNASKPARSAAETWVAQAAADWSREHLEDDAGRVSQHLERAFRALTGAPKPVHAGVHRWRFAQTEKPAGQAYQFSAELGLGTCGDWHLGGKCEHAFLSGSALAKAALTRPPA
ncbi:MAG: NAD/FAD-dependent oxidoreductase, partial [Pseudomonadota bacterium]